MENMKRSIRRLVPRLAILAVVVVCGAFAIAQVQRGDVATSQPPNATEPTTSEPDVSSTAAVPDILASSTWSRFDTQFPEVPAATVQIMHDSQVRQAQAEVNSIHSGFESFDNTYSPKAQQSNPIRNNLPGALSEAAPPAKFAVDTLEAQVLLTQGADTSALHAELPATDATPQSKQFGDEVDVGLEAELLSEAEPDTHRFVPPDGSPTTSTPDTTISESASESDRVGNGPGADDLGANPRFDDSNSEPRGYSNPVRTENQTFPVTAPPESVTIESSPRAEPSAAHEEPSQFIDRRMFGDTPTYATADVLGSGNDAAVAGVGRPGPRELEGPQSPALTIRKIAPTNVRVGQPATFQIKIRNVGQVSVEHVLVRDEIPLGTILVDTQPRATATAEGAVLWQLGTLRPGEEETVSMQVTPTEEGPIGSVATLTFQTLASARANATKPMLELEHSGPRQVLVGELVHFTIRLSNPGSGDATQVVLEEDVPAGLSHSKGPQLQHEIGTIPAGETRRVQLSLRAAKAGPVENVVVARAEGGLIAEHRIHLEVIAPELRVQVKGPTHRYLERKATFTLAIENPGTAPAKNVELMARLPKTLKFVSTNNNGRYNRATNTIRWSLDQLPAGQFGEVKFTTTPTQMGEFNIHAEATANMGLRAEQDHRLEVDGIAALAFSVTDQVDPIEVGGITTYEIHVKNQGTKDAGNIRFVALVPPGMKAIDGSGPTAVRIEGERVFCGPITRLPAKGESTYTIRVQGVTAGDQRFRVEMTSDATLVPVIKEESTRVYSD